MVGDTTSRFGRSWWCGGVRTASQPRATAFSRERMMTEESPERYGVAAGTVRDVLLTILKWGTDPGSPGPSRKQVAAHLSMSSATVSKAVTYLIDDSYLLQEPDRQDGRPGRREAPLRIYDDRCHFAGISVREPAKGRPGELFGVVINLGGGVVNTAQLLTVASTPRELIPQVCNLLDGLTKGFRESVLGCGLALGGQILPREGLVRHSWNFSPPWEDVPLAHRLQRETQIPTKLVNDANALALHEQWFGLGRRTPNYVVARITQDGVGFGIVAQGALLEGEDGINGELGHAEIDSGLDAEVCRCGKRGCLEVYTRRAAKAVESGRTGRSTSATKHIRIGGDALGRVLAQLQLTSASSRILVCGGELVADRDFQSAVLTAFERRPFLASLHQLVLWQRVSEQQVAQGAAASFLPLVPFLGRSRNRDSASVVSAPLTSRYRASTGGLIGTDDMHLI